MVVAMMTHREVLFKFRTVDNLIAGRALIPEPVWN
jgi:hypothetical protein